MEKKEKIFSKLNIKDYTNRLEKILEKKEFSVDTKNLLLSMLYKIENGYNDYNKTKVQTLSKNDFIENIFKIIKDKCNQIDVAEFNSESGKILKEKNAKYIIDKAKGKITVVGNELLVFNSILKMAEHEICMAQEKSVLQKPISNLLNLGNRMNNIEVIRDFNGWSWDIVTKEVVDIDVNIIFQTLMYLSGNEFINNWIQNESPLADYLELLQENLKENYGEKRAEKIIMLICKLAIDIETSQNEEQYEFWKERKESLNKELDILENKKTFLSQKTKEKKDYSKQIQNIDKILNNKELLNQEYTVRNEKLPNKEKIFSISHLVSQIENEREELLNKIKECNKLIQPKGYVDRKQEVEEKVKFLDELDLNSKKTHIQIDDENSELQDIKTRKNAIIELCNIFIECFQIKIAKAKTKQEILEYIYELRYYGFLPIDKQGNILKENSKLNSEFNKTKKQILEKAKKLDVIDEITDDEEINEQILYYIFDSKMIDLNHMIIETRVTDGKLYVDYYDEKVLDSSIEVHSNRTVKLKKRTKLFI